MKTLKLFRTVITFCKIPVVRSKDSILAVRIINMSCPLTNTGTAGIG